MTREIKFHSVSPLGPSAKQVLSQAVTAVFGDDRPTFVKSAPGPNVLCFGTLGGIPTLNSRQMVSYPFPERYLTLGLSRVAGIVPDHPLMGDDVLFLDMESHNAGEQWSMPPREFFRLGQYAWGPYGEVHLTTDYDLVIDLIRQARIVVAHNGHPFDLSVLFGKDSLEALEMARDMRIFDTMVFANLVCPAPYQYTDRAGHHWKDAAKPERAKRWLSLDNLCFQLGVGGKEGNLADIARKYNPENTIKDDLDYGLIPVDDPDFQAYAVRDVKSLQELTVALITMHLPNEYDWREQLNAAIDAQNSRNGFRVNAAKAQARVNELKARRDIIMADLQTKYGLPTEGKMPWRTTPGKAAIMKALADHGITPETVPTWELTKTGNISLGGQVLIDITDGTDAADLGLALSEIMGQRSLAQLALDSMQPDGFVHPEITSLQRSGRKSTTKPGLTVWGSRNGRDIDKAYFIPDNEDERLVSFDYSQADARITAAYSGDTEFAKRFEEGVDAHELTGRVVFGNTAYNSDPAHYRHLAKNLGHATAYRARPKKLALMSGQPLHITETFIEGWERAYPLVTRWQDAVTEEGDTGYVTNDWGRCMVVDEGRAYNQAPALYGQSGTRELMVDALIRMLYYDIRIISWLKAQVHDELVTSIPVAELHWAVPKIEECMTTDWKPSGDVGQTIHFPVSKSEPVTDWQKCEH